MTRLIPLLCVFAATVHAQPATDVSAMLTGRPLTEAIPLLETELKREPRDEARLALGVAQTLHAVENLAAGWYTLGLRDMHGFGPTGPFAISVPSNPNSAAVNGAAIDETLRKFIVDLRIATATLEAIRDPNLKLIVPIGNIVLDFNGPAEGGAMPLSKLLEKLEMVPEATGPEVRIAADLGDARWLEGYTHLLTALSEVMVGYDKSDLVARVGHMMFRKVDSPFAAALADTHLFDFGGGNVDIADIIAMIHLLNLPVQDANALADARVHFLKVIDCSRRSWDAIEAETDNELEWVPNPQQDTIVGPDMKLSADAIVTWRAALGDVEALLEGRKLVPFWRRPNGERENEDKPQPLPGKGRGVNLKKVFTEPRRFDLVLWMQGSDAVPYLEDGPLLHGTNFEKLDEIAPGGAFLFAFWVN